MSLLLHAPAKLNLFLEVTGKREDGYHTLSTLSAFTEFGDLINLEASDSDSLKVTGEFANEISTENNLIIKALSACRRELGIAQKFSIILEKNIPVGAGLGGGSADAAAIVKHFISDEKTAKKICTELGADVFMCWLSRPALLGGIGDSLIRFEDVPPYHTLLINPRTPLSTENVFKRLSSYPRKPVSSSPDSHLRGDDITNLSVVKSKSNHLTETAISILPEISDILSLLEKHEGCRLARMSGSGATCFALFNDESAAIKCEESSRKSFPKYWIKKTQIKKAT